MSLITVYKSSLVAQMVKNLPAMQEAQVRSLSQEDPLEKGMATHSSIIVWTIPVHRSLVGYSSGGSQTHLKCLKSLEKAIDNSFLNHICLSLLGLLYQNTIGWVVSTADICFSQVWMLEVQD